MEEEVKLERAKYGHRTNSSTNELTPLVGLTCRRYHSTSANDLVKDLVMDPRKKLSAGGMMVDAYTIVVEIVTKYIFTKLLEFSTSTIKDDFF